MVDYEGEMAFVIGKNVDTLVEDALDVIAGVTICNDVSVRDWQIASPTLPWVKVLILIVRSDLTS